jgi:nucleoside 2-deoxyribosyltransferase
LRKKIYVAGPLFSIYERRFLEEIVDTLSTKLNLDSQRDFFLPHRDAGDVGIAGRNRNDVFYDDIRYLEECQFVIALLDGIDTDSGTAVEIGYAYAKGKRIFALLTDKRRWDGSNIVNINNMIWGACQEGRRIYRSIDALVNELKAQLHNLI